MRRAFLFGWVLFLITTATVGQEPGAAERRASFAWVEALQQPNGAFAADRNPNSKANLPTTSTALRALKYFGGSPKNTEAAVAFAKSCFDPQSGGIAPTPGAKPDVRSTAIGIMAMIELKMPIESYVGPVSDYLCANAKQFEDVRIAAAGFEAMKAPCKQADAWIAELREKANPDGTFGKGGNQARDTASVAVTLLRLGTTVDKKDAVLRAMRSGQRPEGGWGKEGEPADLETTYRVMRGFMMMKEKPDVAACRAFIAKCRKEDGSYGVQPDQPGSLSGTYYAGIILHWMQEMK